MRKPAGWVCGLLVLAGGAAARVGAHAADAEILSTRGGGLVLTNQVAAASGRRAAWRPAPSHEARASAGQRPPYADLVARLAALYGVDDKLVHAVIAVESGYDPDAVSHRGAVGLMQLMPATASELGIVRLRDPHDNILGGVKLLHRLLDHYEGDISLSIAAYNAGAGAVDRYGGVPPYPETLRFVARVLSRYRGGTLSLTTKKQDRIFTYINARGSLVLTQYPSGTTRTARKP